MTAPLNQTITVEFQTPSGWLFYIEAKAEWDWADDDWPVSMNPVTGSIRYETCQYPELQDVLVIMAETFKGTGPAHKIKPGKHLDEVICSYWEKFEEAFQDQAVEPIYKNLEP